MYIFQHCALSTPSLTNADVMHRSIGVPICLQCSENHHYLQHSLSLIFLHVSTLKPYFGLGVDHVEHQ